MRRVSYSYGRWSAGCSATPSLGASAAALRTRVSRSSCRASIEPPPPLRRTCPAPPPLEIRQLALGLSVVGSTGSRRAFIGGARTDCALVRARQWCSARARPPRRRRRRGGGACRGSTGGWPWSRRPRGQCDRCCRERAYRPRTASTSPRRWRRSSSSLAYDRVQDAELDSPGAEDGAVNELAVHLRALRGGCSDERGLHR